MIASRDQADPDDIAEGRTFQSRVSRYRFRVTGVATVKGVTRVDYLVIGPGMKFHETRGDVQIDEFAARVRAPK